MEKAIKDIKINRISVEKDDEGKESITGSYSLLSPSGAVMAKQSFNGYNSVKLEPSEKTRKLLLDMVLSFKEDITNSFFGGK